MNLTSDKTARKEIPLARGFLDYFPLAAAEVAHVSHVGNQQHNPGEPLHWAKHKSTDHADCVARHLIERGTVDTDGLRHSAKVAWRAMAMLQIELEHAGSTRADNPKSVLDPLHEKGKLIPQESVDRYTSVSYGHDNPPPGYAPCTRKNGHDGPCAHPLSSVTFRGQPTPFVCRSDPDDGDPDGGNIENGQYAHEEVEAQSLKAMLTQKATDEAKLVAFGCSPKVAEHIVGGITYCGVQNAPYVYIAGPMRGYPQFNFPAFDAARDRFVTAGFNVISPADIDRAAGDENSDDQTTFVYRDFYAIFFLKVGTEGNGMIAVLPRFERSTGTAAEFFLARWLGLPILDAVGGDKLAMSDVCESDLIRAVEDFIKGQ